MIEFYLHILLHVQVRTLEDMFLYAPGTTDYAYC